MGEDGEEVLEYFVKWMGLSYAEGTWYGCSIFALYKK